MRTVGNVGPKMTTWRVVIWPRDSLLLGGRERERAQEREKQEGQGLKYPSVGLSMI
jgi:hypothetical protein